MPDPTYEDVYEPPMLDSTGQAIAGAIQGLNPPVPAFISDAFSVERSYSAGDITIYENKIYIFTSSKSAGAWDSTKVTETTIGAICSATNSSLARLKMTSNQIISFTTVTSTETQYNSYNSRKFSDYDYLVFTFLNGLNDIRDTKIVPRAEWTSGKQVVMNVLHGSSGSSASGFSVAGVVIKYNSDTSIKANYTGSGTIKDIIVYGLLLNN